MASVDKYSVRQQVDSITHAFEKPGAEGKLSLEVKILMPGMLTIINLILSVFMEKQTRRTSKNSGLPPSQTSDGQTSDCTQSGSNKKRRSLNGSVSNKRERVTVETATVDTCRQCGDDLHDIPGTDTERRTRIDIIFEKVTQPVDAEIKQCPTCDTFNKPKLIS